MTAPGAPRRHPKGPTDKRLEEIIGALLRTGVVAATIVVAAGAVLLLLRHGGDVPDYRTFRGEPRALRGFAGIAADAIRPSGRAIVQLGLVLLVATPVARVLFSIFGFAAQRDVKFVVVTAVVLAVLSWSLFGRAP